MKPEEIINCPYGGSPIAAQYLRGALSEEDRKRYEAHLEVCELCREDLASARRLKKLIEDYEKDGSPENATASEHFTEERIFDFLLGRLDYDGGLFLQHLLECAACTGEVLRTSGIFEARKKIRFHTEQAMVAH
jgi:hypothetical protein